MIRIELSREMAAGNGSAMNGEAAAWRATGLSKAGLSRFLHLVQEKAGVDGEVDVLLAGDGTLRRLNRTYRGKNKATDVLSFPAAKEFEASHGGDLAISMDTAMRQAREHGHTLRDEVRVLLLHGALHLSGMDHETDGGEMAAREAVLRRELRLPGSLIERVEGGVAAKTCKGRKGGGRGGKRARS